MIVFPPGFVEQYESLSAYLAAGNEAATLMYRESHRLPRRMVASSLIHPIFRLKAEDRREVFPNVPSRGAAAVEALGLLDASDASVLIRSAGNRLEMTRSQGGTPTILGREDLIALFEEDLLIVATDRFTLLRMIGVLDASPDGDQGNKLAKFVEWASANRVGSHVAVLTDALAQRFHTPLGMHAGKIDHWGKAHAVDPETWDGLWMLLRCCTEDSSLNQTQVTCYSSIARDTAYGLDKMWHHVSNDAANGLFFLSRNIETARVAAMNADPIRILEALRTGDGCAMFPVGSEWPMQCAVSSPTRLKLNSQYAVFTSDMVRLGFATVTGLGVDAESQVVTAELSAPTAQVSPWLMAAVGSPQTFYLVEKLFLDTPSSRTPSPWAKSTPVESVSGRIVPHEVLAAAQRPQYRQAS